jgi:hypothetical protein
MAHAARPSARLPSVGAHRIAIVTLDTFHCRRVFTFVPPAACDPRPLKADAGYIGTIIRSPKRIFCSRFLRDGVQGMFIKTNENSFNPPFVHRDIAHDRPAEKIMRLLTGIIVFIERGT